MEGQVGSQVVESHEYKLSLELPLEALEGHCNDLLVVPLTHGWGRSKAQDQSGSSYDGVATGGGTRGGGRTLHKNGDSRSRKMEMNSRHISKSNQWDFGEYWL